MRMLLDVFKIVISDIYLKILDLNNIFLINKMNTDTDFDEKLFFETVEKMSLSELRELFSNLKYVGMSDEDIDKYALAYKKFYEERVRAQTELMNNQRFLGIKGMTGPMFKR